MKTTPLDIKNQTFGKRFRGYDPDEVNTYLEMLSQEFEEAVKEKNQLTDRLEKLQSKLSDYENIEKTLKDTLLATQRSAEQSKENAERQARLIVREAKVKADDILKEAYKELSDLKQKIANLKNLKEAYMLNFKSLLDTQRRMLRLVAGEEVSDSDYSEPIEKIGEEENSKPPEEDKNQMVEVKQTSDSEDK